jgi:hypothetical protein
MVVVRIAAGAFLVAHGLVHLLYLADDVPEFSMDQSWLVPGAFPGSQGGGQASRSWRVCSRWSCWASTGTPG